MWQLTVRNFNDPFFPNYCISVDRNNWIFSNDFVLNLNNIIKMVTWTSGCIKLTDWIIILTYWSCIWPHFFSFKRSNILTTYFIIHFSTSQISCLFFRNGLFFSFMFIINFFTSWIFSIYCYIFLFVINFCTIFIFIIDFCFIFFNKIMFVLIINFIIYTLLHII